MTIQFATKKSKIFRRHVRIRTRVSGTAKRPRLAVAKSHSRIYVQLIDDERGHTLVAGSTKETKGDTLGARATALGTLIAKKAKENKISTVVFDRGGYHYTGNIRALAESARKAGLVF